LHVESSPLKELLNSLAHDLARAHPYTWLAIVRESNLLFTTWRIDPAVLRPLLPPQIELDLYDGYAWLTIESLDSATPKFRLLPPPTTPKEGIQVNVRTYVTCAGEPGIFVFSSDCPGGLATPIRRALMLMQFYTSTARLTLNGDNYHVESFRTEGDSQAQWAASGRICGPPMQPAAGSIGAFLMTRSILFAVDRRSGTIYRCELAHRPRVVQPIDVVIEANTLLSALGIELPADPPLFHFSQGDDALAWPFTHVDLTAAATPASGAAVL